MALAHLHIQILMALRRGGYVGGGKTPNLLELGEQNWFGDVDANELPDIADQLGVPATLKQEVEAQLAQVLETGGDWQRFSIAKLFYRLVYEHERYVAIDLNGSPGVALAYDLNSPVPLQGQFEVVTNFGTSEHVFNQYQVFKTMHEHCAPGGLMLHSVPNQGAYDHGFFNYQPTFFFDLCEANGYGAILLGHVDCSGTIHKLTEIRNRAAYVALAVQGRLSKESGLVAVLRMPESKQDFSPPRQGYYEGRLPDELAEAWRQMKR